MTSLTKFKNWARERGCPEDVLAEIGSSGLDAGLWDAWQAGAASERSRFFWAIRDAREMAKPNDWPNSIDYLDGWSDACTDIAERAK